MRRLDFPSFMTEITKPGLNILLVEDDMDDSMFFKEAVQKLEAVNEITVAKNCDQLMGQFEINKTFDVIFLDINLPLLEGNDPEYCWKIKSPELIVFHEWFKGKMGKTKLHQA